MPYLCTWATKLVAKSQYNHSIFIGGDQDWTWKEVGLMISISDNVSIEAVINAVPDVNCIYELRVPDPGLYWLKTKTQVHDFKEKYIELLNDLKNEHGSDTEMYLFPAMPAPIALEIGRQWNPKVHSKMLLYDYNLVNEGFKYCLSL